MGLFFNRDKMSTEAGEWAAVAMACMAFADGGGSTEEVEAASRQAASNPVLRKSIGEERANALFKEAGDAIFAIPAAMLASYEQKLATLAGEIDELDEKNFALAAVIAIAMGDGQVTRAEFDLLSRFKEMLGATIPVPEAGEPAPAVYRQAARTRPPQGTPTVAGADALPCATCQAPTIRYVGHGHWCATCEDYTEAAPKAAAPAPTAGGAAAAPASVTCASCGQPAELYEGYGWWCKPCQQYATA